MKIALLHYSSPPIVGGVESVLAHHARLMNRAGHQVTILAGRGKTFDQRIPVRVLPRLDSRDHEVMQIKALLDEGIYSEEFDRLRDLIKEDLAHALAGVDVLVAHNVASLHKNLALTAAIHAAHGKPGFPKLILWHHDLAWTAPRYRRELHPGYPWDLLCQPWENAVNVVISELRREELTHLSGLQRDSIQVIPNGVDLTAFFKLEPETIRLVEELHLDQSDPLFLLPVRLTPRKNIEMALHVLARLREELPKAGLLITGPEGPHNPANAMYKSKLLALRDALNLQGAAHFLAQVRSEFLPDAVIADFYHLADALLFPSKEEGFGIPLIEAAFSSKPVFCADIQVLRELGREDLNYFDPDGDPASTATMILSTLKNDATSRWSRRAKHHYTWDSIYDLNIEPLIQRVAK